jgi:hypothetical protein
MASAFSRQKPSSRFERDQGPVVVGGVGGSGTRVVVDIMRRLRVYTGSDLNKAGDNKWFSLLCKLPRWDLDPAGRDTSEVRRCLEILEKAMTGLLVPTREDRRTIAEVVRRCSNFAKKGDLRDDRTDAWLNHVAGTLAQSQDGVPEDYPLWGWKEPNSHLFLPHLSTYFGDRLRYVHVIRNGVYMAHSTNQAQPRRWGPEFGIEGGLTTTPVRSLDYWIASNEQAIERGRAMPQGSFLLVNHDDLCKFPREEVRRFVEFLAIDTPEETMEELMALPNPARPLEFTLEQMRQEFGDERLAKVRALGFSLDGAEE